MKKAFTLVELLVVVVAVSMLVAVMFYGSGCGIGNAISEARKSACQANLKIIGGAFREYELKNARFARIRGHVSGDAAAKYEPAGTSDKLEDVAVAPMNEIWVLVERALIPENILKCGGDKDWKPRMVDGTTIKINGWSSDTQFSYGIQFPYDKNLQGTRSAANPSISPEKGGFTANSVFMADMAKRGAADPVVKKSDDLQNHRDGISYLTRGGTVGFHTRPTPDSVIHGDEIYADALSGDGICPANSPADSVICPGAIDGK
ncbi:MAG: prepilin-type N-terminal cleavage/methylation domain-containing protein [Planctomycetaceae bacterium]|nr:prepilin-type N-terminal cleavage/methylation domain-containing protein [Planctomycetaceae bacterium]